MRISVRVAFVAALAVLAGCGDDVPRSDVHGTVKYQGKPLGSGMVILLASDRKTHLADLKPDGTYEASGVARGRVKVSIQQLPPRPDPRPERPAKKAEYADEKAAANPPEFKFTGPRIPETYADPDKSGLAFDLTEAKQEWSTDLK
jgi:hypothetical protein